MATGSSINTLEYDASLCTNCAMCSTVCPHCVFSPGENTAILSNPDACMECGACRLNCPAGAIQVESGVGCAAAMIYAALMRRPEPTCG